LLVLDNCEHLAAACAELVMALVQDCPSLSVLATSRERLRMNGEAVFAVPPLALPRPGKQLAPGEFARFDAITLFLDRASALNGDLALSADDEEAVVTLCRNLDGLPLAIELLAGRTGVLSIKALVDRQDDRFGLLSSGNRSAPPRHQTLRATVDYSHELCSEGAQTLWAWVSVFAGGATLDAIIEVCSDGASSAGDVELALAELVEKSIVAFDGTRYHMLETIRAYGQERLRTLGREDAAQTAHRDYFGARASQAADSRSGGDQLVLLGRLLADLANLRAALEFCLGRPEQVTAGLGIAGRLWPFWLGCGLQREGRHWLGELLAADTGPSPQRVSALWADGYLAVFEGDMEAGLAMANECRQLAEHLHDLAAIAHATFVRGAAKLFLDQLGTAVSDLETAVRLEREVSGSHPLLVSALRTLGAALCCGGDLERAMEVLVEARALSEDRGDQLQLSWSLIFLGLAALLDGRLADASELLKEVLVRNRLIGDLLGMNTAVEFLAWVSLDSGDAVRAAQLLGASQVLAEPLGAHLPFVALRRRHEDRFRHCRAVLGERAFNAALASGRQFSIEEAISFALEEKPRDAGGQLGDTTPLSRREQEVANLVAAGKSNREIASELVISQRTAEGHVEHILTKLGCTSRAQVVALFARSPKR